jgi:hypothetical protein
MKWLLVLMVIGCDESRENPRKWYLGFGRDLIECSTAEVVATSMCGDGGIKFDGYGEVRTWKVTGCGIKVCCVHDCDSGNKNGHHCFGCMGSKWY